MRIGIPTTLYASAIAAVGFTPIGAISEIVEHRRYSGGSGNAEINTTWGVDITQRESSAVDFCYISGVQGMIDGGLTTISVDNFTTTYITSINLQSGSPTLNSYGDILLAEGLNVASWSQYTSTNVGVVFVPNGNSVQPDHALIHAGVWVEKDTCPTIDDANFSKVSKTVTLEYPDLTTAEATGFIRSVVGAYGQTPVIMYDENHLFDHEFRFQCVALTRVEWGIEQNDIYSLSIEGVLV